MTSVQNDTVKVSPANRELYVCRDTEEMLKNKNKSIVFDFSNQNNEQNCEDKHDFSLLPKGVNADEKQSKKQTEIIQTDVEKEENQNQPKNIDDNAKAKKIKGGCVGGVAGFFSSMYLCALAEELGYEALRTNKISSEIGQNIVKKLINISQKHYDIVLNLGFFLGIGAGVLAGKYLPDEDK